jgi:hypothetical protein
MTSVAATRGQLNRAKSESWLRGSPSRGRGYKERGFLTPRTSEKIGIFQAIFNGMKGKKSGDKGRESSQSSEPALIPMPNVEEDDILAEIKQQKEEEADNFCGTDPLSHFSSIGVSSMGDITDFFQRPAADPRTRSPTHSKSAATPTTPPGRGILRHSWLFRQNNVGKDATIIVNASSCSSSRTQLEKEQNGWESPLVTPTKRASRGLRNSGAHGGLMGSSPLAASRLPRPPLAGPPPLHSGITSPRGQKGKVCVRQPSLSSAPKSEVPRVPARESVSSVSRGREQPPLPPARNIMSQSYSPPPRDSPATPPPLHSGITSPRGQKGKVCVRQPSLSSVPKSKIPRVPARENVSSVSRGREQPPLPPARNIMSQSYSPPPRDSPAIPRAPPKQNASNDQPVRGSRDFPPLAPPGAQSIPLSHHPASPISGPPRRRSDSGRNFSGRSLTLTPTKPGASPSSKSPNSSVEGSLEDMKRSSQRSGSAQHMNFRSYQDNKTVSTEDKKPDHASVSQIEIAPGIFKPLRGSEETWKAIETGNIVPTACLSCSLSLHCLDDAEYVICPACQVVGPVECCLQGFGRGIGLGVRDEQLARCREEMRSRRA